MLYCTVCGKKVPLTGRFCRYCGTALKPSSDFSGISSDATDVTQKIDPVLLPWRDATLKIDPALLPYKVDVRKQNSPGSRRLFEEGENRSDISHQERNDILMEKAGKGLVQTTEQVQDGNRPMVEEDAQSSKVSTQHETPSNGDEHANQAPLPARNVALEQSTNPAIRWSDTTLSQVPQKQRGTVLSRIWAFFYTLFIPSPRKYTGSACPN